MFFFIIIIKSIEKSVVGFLVADSNFIFNPMIVFHMLDALIKGNNFYIPVFIHKEQSSFVVLGQ